MDDIELHRAAVEAGAFIAERGGAYGNFNAGSVIFTASEWAKFCAAITADRATREMPSSQPAPTGWKLVPVQPTIEMSIAFAERFYSRVRCVDDDDISDWWSAMLAAAPAATQPAVNESVAVRALRIAHCHIDMDALRISHCKDAAAIEGAIAAWNRRSHQERALVADAERYRFLRNRALDGDEEEMPCIRAADNDPSHWALKGEEADAAIDAARGVSIPDGGTP